MENKDHPYPFHKKLVINDIDDNQFLMNTIKILFHCMKETNKLHGVTSELFRLDFRDPLPHEWLGPGTNKPMIMDFKWGSMKEWEEKSK